MGFASGFVFLLMTRDVYCNLTSGGFASPLGDIIHSIILQIILITLLINMFHDVAYIAIISVLFALILFSIFCLFFTDHAQRIVSRIILSSPIFYFPFSREFSSSYVKSTSYHFQIKFFGLLGLLISLVAFAAAAARFVGLR